MSWRSGLIIDKIESLLEKERDRIGLWLPVALGLGIAFWFWLDRELYWFAILFLCAAMLSIGLQLGWSKRAGRMIALAGLTIAAGLLLIWVRAVILYAPVLGYPLVTSFAGRVEQVEAMPARKKLRLILAPIGRADLPELVQVSLTVKRRSQDDIRPNMMRIMPGDVIGVRVRLLPPPGPMLPGAYDYAKRAWFKQIGAVGSILGEPNLPVGNPSEHDGAGEATKRLPALRDRLSAHIQGQISGSAGGIAATLATGDRGGITEEDAEAMRRSGLAHLLSISGLHVTSVVGGILLILMRFLALFPPLALRWRVPVIAASGAALGAIGYTLLTGAQVPTVRACIAALLILVALIMGREVLTLRLVAAGALLVMLLWPETLVGPSFQLSFAAVTAIIALHESRYMQQWMARRNESWARKFMRVAGGLLLTGIVVELALIPIALFHFHKAGYYGALANLVAIPLTSFVIMPAEALALAFDVVGLGWFFWWIVGGALHFLLAIAHSVAQAPGAVGTLPQFSPIAFGAILLGGLWFLIWQSRWRWWGLAPLSAGVLAMFATPSPDLLITGDGRHVASKLLDGNFALLRSGASRFVRDNLSDSAGIDSDFLSLQDLKSAECNQDFCRWQLLHTEHRWTILATRSSYVIEEKSLTEACRAADIVIADRWLPPTCRARWMTIDRALLESTGGLALYLDEARYRTALNPEDEHPWRLEPLVRGGGGGN